MEFTQGAKGLIENSLHEIMEYMTLAEKDKADVEKELRSSFYEGSKTRARERGSGVITEEDVKKAIGDQGTPQEIAAAYMRSYAGGLKRAGFWPRAAAYIIDVLIYGIFMVLLILPIVVIIGMLNYSSIMAVNLGFSPVRDENLLFTTIIILLNLTIGLIVLGSLICYFVVLEGRFSRTPGKYVMGLKVLKTDGTRIGYKEALLRNIPKIFGNFIVIDALMMVIFFNKEKQRAFDKVADTIVVHTRG